MRTRAVVVAVLVAAALPGTALGAPGGPLTVKASFVPGVADFGDAVTARVVVTMDEHALRPSSLHVVVSVAPLTQLAAPVVRRTTRAGVALAVYDVRAACLSDTCLGRPVTPDAVQADVARTDGSRIRTRASWAPLTVASRTTTADLRAAKPPFRAETTPPPVTYRLRPALLAGLLDGAAAILAAAAAGLAAATLLRARRPRRQEQVDELARALQLARAARTRPEPDRRAAVGYLARLLSRRDRSLAHAADDLAWSRPAPSPESLTELVDGIEHEDSA